MARFVYNDEVEKIAQEARVAKTNEELADICQRLNVADFIFLDRVDLKFAKLTSSTIYRTLKKYPDLRNSINYFGTLNGFIRNREAVFLKLNKRVDSYAQQIFRDNTEDIARDCRHSFENDGLAMAFSVSGTHDFSGIIINGKTFSERQVVESLEYGERIGHSPRGCKTVKSVMDHEIGHIFDFVLGISKSKDFSDFIRNYGLDDVSKGLSNYCVINNVVAVGEVVADGYSEYCNNPAPREIALNVGNMIERKYEEFFKPNRRSGGFLSRIGKKCKEVFKR